jgi:hypothetical protein
VKQNEVFVAFMDLEKAYDRVDKLAMWEVLRIYGVGGKFPSAIKSMYEESKVSVIIGQKFGNKIESGCKTWLCDVPIVLQYFFIDLDVR